MIDKPDMTTETLLEQFLHEAKEIKVDKDVMRLIMKACLPVVTPGVTLTLKAAVNGTKKALEATNVRVIGLESVIERLIIFFIDKGILDKGEISELQEQMLSMLREELSLSYDVKETDLLIMLDVLMKSVKGGKIASVDELAKTIHFMTFAHYSLEDLKESLTVLFERLTELGYLRGGK
jgi:hypothetical protein